MVRARSIAFSRITLILVGALALAGCQVTQGTPSAAGVGASLVAGPGQRVIERDVEAPDVFQVEEAGLWDGRPSLGGVWVAHPDVDDPERAMIRNPATGQEVIGALFRRERENPGPRFQISSEAANALGILPGAPTDIAVTALRLQRVELEVEPAPRPVTAAEETLAIAPVEHAPAEGAAGDQTTRPAAAPDGQVEIVEEDRPRGGLFGLFRRRQPDAAEAIAQSTLAPVEGAAEVAADVAADVAAETVTETASAAAPAGAAGAEAPRRRGGLFGLFRRDEPAPEADPDTTMIALPGGVAAPGTAPAPRPAAAPAQPQGPGIDRPFVQIGIFSIEQNAINSRAQMQRAGLSAEIRRGRVGENLFWRVVVGPAGSTAERADVLRRVRAMGFADAYAVVR